MRCDSLARHSCSALSCYQLPATSVPLLFLRTGAQAIFITAIHSQPLRTASSFCVAVAGAGGFVLDLRPKLGFRANPPTLCSSTSSVRMDRSVADPAARAAARALPADDAAPPAVLDPCLATEASAASPLQLDVKLESRVVSPTRSTAAPRAAGSGPTRRLPSPAAPAPSAARSLRLLAVYSAWVVREAAAATAAPRLLICFPTRARMRERCSLCTVSGAVLSVAATVGLLASQIKTRECARGERTSRETGRARYW